MARRRDATADNQGCHLYGGIEFADRAERQDGTGWDSDKGMGRVPGSIHAGNFVGEELSTIHGDHRGDHRRMIQDLQIRRQIHIAGCNQYTEGRQPRIQIQSGDPGEIKGGNDKLGGFHRCEAYLSF